MSRRRARTCSNTSAFTTTRSRLRVFGAWQVKLAPDKPLRVRAEGFMFGRRSRNGQSRSAQAIQSLNIARQMLVCYPAQGVERIRAPHVALRRRCRPPAPHAFDFIEMPVSTMVAHQLRRQVNRRPELVRACIGHSSGGRTPGPVAFDSVAERALFRFRRSTALRQWGAALSCWKASIWALDLAAICLSFSACSAWTCWRCFMAACWSASEPLFCA